MAVMEKLLSTVDAVFEEKQEIKASTAELDMTELKVRKLLITSGKIHYPQTGEIQELQKAGKKPEEIQNIFGLSRASINAYLPYCKIPYKESEVSANAERCELYRLRKVAIAKICDGDTLWYALLLIYVVCQCMDLKPFAFTILEELLTVAKSKPCLFSLIKLSMVPLLQ